jgi:tetratricopeptide (TPR) repeat protein
MKLIFLIMLSLFFVACSSSRIERKINDVTWDSLADESYLRWGESRLQKYVVKDHPVVKCYQGEVKETLQQYRKDYLTKNQHPLYWLHVGNCYFIQESWSKAEFFYRMTLDEIKLPSIQAIALNNLGLIYFKYQYWEKGKEFLRRSMVLGPKLKVPRYNLSQLFLQFGHYDRAIDVLSDSAFRDHKDIDVYFSLANAWLFKNDLKKSAFYFNMIPEEHFRREDIAATYALFLIRKGKIQDAKQIMTKRNRSDVPELTLISQKIEKILLQRLKED